MKKHSMMISLRNMLIVLSVLTVAVLAAELYLKADSQKNAYESAQIQENRNLLLMGIERIPTKDLNTALPLTYWVQGKEGASD